ECPDGFRPTAEISDRRSAYGQNFTSRMCAMPNKTLLADKNRVHAELMRLARAGLAPEVRLGLPFCVRPSWSKTMAREELKWQNIDADDLPVRPSRRGHLLHTAHDANALGALDPNHTTAPQDMTKVQLPHHHGDFHFA